MQKAIILKFKRTKWQFSLRVMIVLTLLLACAMAYLTSYARRAKRERAIVEQYAATAFYDFQYDEEDDENHTDATPPGPWILRRIFGDTVFPRVRQLEIKRNASLINVDRLRELTGLETLSIGDCPQFKNLDGFANSQLRHLTLYKCQQLRDIDSVYGLTSLVGVSFWECPALHNVNGIRRSNLTRFKLRSCPLVKDIDALKGNSNLRFCYFNDCPGLKHVDGLIDRTLTSFSITASDQLLTPRGLSSLGRARHVDLIRFDIKSREEVWIYFDGKTLRLFRCPKLLNLKGVDQAICKETLELSECPLLTSLDGLEKSTAGAVCIFHCDTLSDIKALDEMLNLKHVRIDDCRQVDPSAIKAIYEKVEQYFKATG